MKCTKLFEIIDGLYEKYLTIWEDICNIESPTDCKQGVDAVGNYAVNIARSHGWQVEKLPQKISGDAICITMNPDAKPRPVSLSAHMDTVHPVGLFGTPAVTKDETYIYGPGVTDDKGGVDGGKIHAMGEYAVKESLKDAAKRVAAVAYCI